MKDATIKKFEAAGFKRWTKNGMDRLYIDAEALGLEVERYGTGNIKSATWQGEKVSNADARRILASKAYIDVETGELHASSDFEKYGMPTVEEMARELVESIEDEEPQPEQLDDAAAQELAEDAATMADSKSWERQSRYNERMTRQYPIRLNTKTDADVIEHLDGLSESRAGYIKRLIREDMMKHEEH